MHFVAVQGDSHICLDHAPGTTAFLRKAGMLQQHMTAVVRMAVSNLIRNCKTCKCNTKGTRPGGYQEVGGVPGGGVGGRRGMQRLLSATTSKTELLFSSAFIFTSRTSEHISKNAEERRGAEMGRKIWGPDG